MHDLAVAAASITWTVSLSGWAKLTQICRPSGPRDGEYRLAMDRDAADLPPVLLHVDDQELVPADRRQEGVPPGDRHALKVRHLVDGQRLLATAVAVENAPHTRFGMPQIEQRQPVLAEQARPRSSGRPA